MEPTANTVGGSPLAEPTRRSPGETQTVMDGEHVRRSPGSGDVPSQTVMTAEESASKKSFREMTQCQTSPLPPAQGKSDRRISAFGSTPAWSIEKILIVAFGSTPARRIKKKKIATGGEPTCRLIRKKKPT